MNPVTWPKEDGRAPKSDAAGSQRQRSRERLADRFEQIWPDNDLATWGQLVANGAPERTISAARTAGAVVRVRRGIYARAGTWSELPERDRNLQRIRAHRLTTAGSFVYSHSTAARLHGCYIWDIPFCIHIVQGYCNHGRNLGADVISHRTSVPAGQTVLPACDPVMRVTSLERTIIDCARIEEFRRAAIIGDHALHLGADVGLVHEMLAAGVGSPGIKRARQVVAALDGRSESPGETLTRLAMQQLGIAAPVPQYEIRTAYGLHRADFAWPELMLILEFDGRTKYVDLGPTAEVLLAERNREKRLMENGWSFVRLEWRDLFKPEELNARIRTAMDRARRLNGRPDAAGLTQPA